MAEYNVQINKYNANNLGYDQLYPQPMKHADTHLLNGSDPINIGELGVSNRNILDNAYFANPDAIIDQRGGYVVPPNVTVYTDSTLSTTKGTTTAYNTILEKTASYARYQYGYVSADAVGRGYTGGGYTIDRFKLGTDGGAVLICDGYLRIVKTGSWLNLEQRVDNFSALKGKKLTVSALVDGDLNLVISIGGNRYPFNFYHRGSKGVVSGTFVVPDDATNLSVIFQAADTNGANIYAAKLELGDKQTLAHQDENGNLVLNDPPPNKAVELMKCQRCQIPIGASAVYSGQTNSSKDTTGAFFIPLPVSMRATPVIANLSLDTWAIRCNGVSKTPTAITVSGITPNGVTCAFACETGFGVRQSVVIYKADGKELLDANL